MKNNLIISVKLLMVFTIITGVIYPLFITAIGKIFFPFQAEGSVLYKDGKPVGSELIAQAFTSDKYFHPRPSSVDYNPIPSGASNLGAADKRLKILIEERERAFYEKNILPRATPIPAEMLTASGSGVDPHITVEAALMQVERISRAREFGEFRKNKLIRLIFELEERPVLEMMGKNRVNVLKLNMALDKLY